MATNNTDKNDNDHPPSSRSGMVEWFWSSEKGSHALYVEHGSGNSISVKSDITSSNNPPVLTMVEWFWIPEKGHYEQYADAGTVWPEHMYPVMDDPQIVEWERLEEIVKASGERPVFDDYELSERKPQRQSKRMCCRHFSAEMTVADKRKQFSCWLHTGASIRGKELLGHADHWRAMFYPQHGGI
jgi:hypothetical protein